MRSKLFVPGSKPELFAKALASQAEAISIDLEDSVVPGRKADARQAVREFLCSPLALSTTKVLIVRTNAPNTADFLADVAAVVCGGLAMLNLPKCESADEVRRAIAHIGDAEKANGLTGTLDILVNIETPTALRCAVQLATADTRIVGLQLGYADLFEEHGIARNDRDNVHAAMFAVRMAAAEAGVFAYDGAFTNIADLAGFQAEAEMSQRLGFIGKSCVHPSQVQPANDVFRPSEDEIARARRVIDAAAKAEAAGIGALLLDGRMIDAPFVRSAKAVLKVAERLKP